MVARALLASVLTVGLASAQFAKFLTRPGQHSVVLEVLQNDIPDTVEKNYIWVTPYTSEFNISSEIYGPHIFDTEGHLVWFGNDSVEVRAMDTHICDYKGQIGNHICYNDANPVQQGGHSSGVVRFFDNHYNEVGRDHGARNGLTGPDIHELNTPAGQGGMTFIQDIFQTIEMDLSMYDGPNPGYILSGCFQEISFENNSVLFQWCSHEHLPINATYWKLRNAGNKFDGTLASPWDYFHINSIGKDLSGNYIVSCRHCHALYKIAGRFHSDPGSVIWRLHGKNNDFIMEPKGFNFSWQHSARWQEDYFNTNTVGISLLDNGFAGKRQMQTAQASNGIIIEIDENTMTATLREQYVQPEGKVTPSQGYLQVLPNSNVFMGWGALPYVSEHLKGGKTVYYAIFGKGSRWPLQSYRSYKLPWIGLPTVPPDILAFSRECRSQVRYVYASWNGATEVVGWRVQTANQTSGPWTQEGGLFKKTSYESRMKILTANFPIFARVLAVGADGKVLPHGTSVPRKFFVPSAQTETLCSDTDCSTELDYSEANSIADTCIE